MTGVGFRQFARKVPIALLTFPLCSVLLIGAFSMSGSVTSPWRDWTLCYLFFAPFAVISPVAGFVFGLFYHLLLAVRVDLVIETGRVRLTRVVAWIMIHYGCFFAAAARDNCDLSRLVRGDALVLTGLFALWQLLLAGRLFIAARRSGLADYQAKPRY